MESCGRNRQNSAASRNGRKHEFRWPALMRSAARRVTASLASQLPIPHPQTAGPRRVAGAGPW